MSVLFGAIICGLALVSIFLLFTLPFALAWGWTRVRSVLVVGKDYDVTLVTVPEVADPQPAPQHSLYDLIDDVPDDPDKARIDRIKKKIEQQSVPTLPGKGQASYVPIRAYSDRKETTTNHNLEILNQ